MFNSKGILSIKFCSDLCLFSTQQYFKVQLQTTTNVANKINLKFKSATFLFLSIFSGRSIPLHFTRDYQVSWECAIIRIIQSCPALHEYFLVVNVWEVPSVWHKNPLLPEMGHTCVQWLEKQAKLPKQAKQDDDKKRDSFLFHPVSFAPCRWQDFIFMAGWPQHFHLLLLCHLQDKMTRLLLAFFDNICNNKNYLLFII